jgi:hypothetical protein
MTQETSTAENGSRLLCKCGHLSHFHEEDNQAHLHLPEFFGGSINGCCSVRRCPCTHFVDSGRTQMTIEEVYGTLEIK